MQISLENDEYLTILVPGANIVEAKCTSDTLAPSTYGTMSIQLTDFIVFNLGTIPALYMATR